MDANQGSSDLRDRQEEPVASRVGRVARVVRNHRPCREHNVLTLAVDAFPPSRPGQFLQVLCRPPAHVTHDAVHDWQPGQTFAPADDDVCGPTALLRRPFSLAGRRDVAGGVELDVISRDIGTGTHHLARVKAGDVLDLIGPLGNGFTLPPPGGIALLVGGGVGIPPMLYLAQAIGEHNARIDDADARIKAVAFAGVLTRDLLPLTVTDAAAPGGPADADPRYHVAEFDAHGIATVVSTDDGSFGWAGRITGPLEAYLDRWFGNSWDVGSRRPDVYTCGPELMMKAVAAVCRRRGLTCFAAVERAMACGLGTCQSCVIRVKSDASDGWRYALSCTEGPVFDTAGLLW